MIYKIHKRYLGKPSQDLRLYNTIAILYQDYYYFSLSDLAIYAGLQRCNLVVEGKQYWSNMKYKKVVTDKKIIQALGF